MNDSRDANQQLSTRLSSTDGVYEHPADQSCGQRKESLPMRAVTERANGGTKKSRSSGAERQCMQAWKERWALTDLLPWHGRGGPEEKGGNSSREGGERSFLSALPGPVGQRGGRGRKVLGMPTASPASEPCSKPRAVSCGQVKTRAT